MNTTVFEPLLLQLKVQRSHLEASLPTYGSSAAAGLDLYACIHTDCEHSMVIECRQTVLVPCHIRLEIPRGFEGQIRSRSGRALTGLIVSNAPGTIDCDYRGEIGVILYNISDNIRKVYHGQRIAQLIIAPVYRPQVIEIETLSSTERNEGGFGSTGR